MRTRLISLALVLALGAGACGDDGDDGDDEATTSTTTAAPGETSSSTGPATGDEAVVAKMVLQQSDFPAGWTAAPSEEEEDDDADRKVAECVGVEFDPDRPEATSPEFSRGELTQVSAAAELAPTPDVAAAELAAIKSPKANECIKTAFNETVAEGSPGVTFSPAQVEVRQAPALGDGAHAVRLSTGVNAPDGSTVPIYADFVFIQKGRAELSLTFINAGQPFDEALARDLAAKLASRA
jgi:hypothetical protein